MAFCDGTHQYSSCINIEDVLIFPLELTVVKFGCLLCMFLAWKLQLLGEWMRLILREQLLHVPGKVFWLLCHGCFDPLSVFFQIKWYFLLYLRFLIIAIIAFFLVNNFKLMTLDCVCVKSRKSLAGKTLWVICTRYFT